MKLKLLIPVTLFKNSQFGGNGPYVLKLSINKFYLK